MWHSAGWNEAGMHCSVAKFIVDAEQCAMAYRMAEGPKWDDFDAAMAAIGEIGPGGHYLGHAHTLEHFQSAFFMPELFDNNSIEQWTAEGSVEITGIGAHRNGCGGRGVSFGRGAGGAQFGFYD
jgi:trimethylamine--corrinoid protein Co-methyltransferase